MHFTVFAIATVPDTSTARFIHGLEGLDEESVGKVLFHRRKQQTGGEALRFDQLGIANLTLIRHAPDFVQIDNHCIESTSEVDILAAYYEAVMRFDRCVSWGGNAESLPVIHARSLVHRVTEPGYFRGLRSGELVHQDLAEWNRPDPDDAPSLDDTARLLGYPGLMGCEREDIWAGGLEGDFAPARAFSELGAINAYLVALRVLSATGDMTRADALRAESKLHEMMGKVDARHLRDYLDAWDHET